ncbi:MAG TPA: LuxR C-terminal-related transcriptional regulator [Candidatus Baltobacteraceae bacterium]|jgi:DNA-binding CsgD family transcriptional regulator|nr:LuxR C-terminal-related transcriptional regulator [Candidatus Baltobacteraceae bacterium]
MDARVGLDDFQRAWLNGDYTGLLHALLAQRASPQRDLFLAQLYLRLGRHADVIQLISSMLSDPVTCSESDVARARSYQAMAHAAQGERRRAQAALGRIGPRDRWDAQTNAEIRLDDALVYWMLNDVGHADDLIRDQLAVTENDVDPYITARFVMLSSWIAAAREDYTAQAQALMESITRLRNAPVPDVGLIAWGVHALATLVRDIDMPEGFALAQEVEATLPWTADLAIQRFRTARALAWCLALQGEYIRAFRKLKEAASFTNDPADQVLVHLDRAHVSFISGQEIVARAELSEADDLIRGTDWQASASVESGALVHAAELFSGVDPHRAEELLAQAAMVKEKMARNISYAHDRRYGAMANFAEALIREALPGRRETARLRALSAFEVFDEIGYKWRAARCAILLHAITGEEQWIVRARELCASYPRSFVAQEVARRQHETLPVERLTVRQRHIYQLVREGKTTEEIGSDLGISPNTVRIHLGRIYDAFGVKSRTQLLARISA